MKKVLFIVPTFEIGGIETFISNLISVASENGYFESLLLVLSNRTDKSLMERVAAHTDVVHLSDYQLFGFLSNNYFFNIVKPTDIGALRDRFKGVTHIHSVDSYTNEFAVDLCRDPAFSKVKLTCGVYHSKEYTWEEKGAYFRDVQKEVFECYPGENVYIANKEVASIYEETFSKKYPSRVTFPFGVDLSKYRAAGPDQTSKNIIMIGRFVKFKAYQSELIRSFSRLRLAEKGYQLHFYGFGSNERNLDDLAKSLEVPLVLHGKVTHDSLPEIFQNAFMFVGGGTTIIEASAAGVPSIIGIESEFSDRTYGFFGDLRGHSYNRNDLEIVKVSIDECIARLLDSDEAFYQAVSNSHRKKSYEFDIDSNAKSFDEYLEGSSLYPYISYSKVRYLCSHFVCIALNVLGLSQGIKTRYD